MLKVRIVSLDFNIQQPIPSLDPMYSEFRGSGIKQVPVIRIFGATDSGVKTCLHVHGVFPYIYIPYDGESSSDSVTHQIATSLDKAINTSLGQTVSNAEHIFKISLVSGIPFYGFHAKKHQFLKIYFYNPYILKKACVILQSGSILGKIWQPHEAHIPYSLQFMMDYNLYGMSFIELSDVRYRSHIGEVPPDKILTVQKTSSSVLEIDVAAEWILNKLDVSSGELGLNPGIQALWDDEKQRRRNRGDPSQVESSLTQNRTDIKPTITHLSFANVLKSKLSKPCLDETSTETSTDLSVYPAETPPDTDVLNASNVEIHFGSQSSDSTITEITLDENGKLLLQVLEDLREQADADSVLSQVIVNDSDGSEEEIAEVDLSLPLGSLSTPTKISDDALRELLEDDDDDSYFDKTISLPQIDGSSDAPRRRLQKRKRSRPRYNLRRQSTTSECSAEKLPRITRGRRKTSALEKLENSNGKPKESTGPSRVEFVHVTGDSHTNKDDLTPSQVLISTDRNFTKTCPLVTCAISMLPEKLTLRKSTGPCKSKRVMSTRGRPIKTEDSTPEDPSCSKINNLRTGAKNSPDEANRQIVQKIRNTRCKVNIQRNIDTTSGISSADQLPSRNTKSFRNPGRIARRRANVDDCPLNVCEKSEFLKEPPSETNKQEVQAIWKTSRRINIEGNTDLFPKTAVEISNTETAKNVDDLPTVTTRSRKSKTAVNTPRTCNTDTITSEDSDVSVDFQTYWEKLKYLKESPSKIEDNHQEVQVRNTRSRDNNEKRKLTNILPPTTYLTNFKDDPKAIPTRMKSTLPRKSKRASNSRKRRNADLTAIEESDVPKEYTQSCPELMNSFNDSSACDISNITGETTNIACDGSNITCDNSNIACDASNIACDSSNIACDSSNITCDASNIACDSSNIACDSSNIPKQPPKDSISHQETPNVSSTDRKVDIERNIDCNPRKDHRVSTNVCDVKDNQDTQNDNPPAASELSKFTEEVPKISEVLKISEVPKISEKLPKMSEEVSKISENSDKSLIAKAKNIEETRNFFPMQLKTYSRICRNIKRNSVDFSPSQLVDVRNHISGNDMSGNHASGSSHASDDTIFLGEISSKNISINTDSKLTQVSNIEHNHGSENLRESPSKESSIALVGSSQQKAAKDIENNQDSNIEKFPVELFSEDTMSPQEVIRIWNLRNNGVINSNDTFPISSDVSNDECPQSYISNISNSSTSSEIFDFIVQSPESTMDYDSETKSGSECTKEVESNKEDALDLETSTGILNNSIVSNGSRKRERTDPLPKSKRFRQHGSKISRRKGCSKSEITELIETYVIESDSATENSLKFTFRKVPAIGDKNNNPVIKSKPLDMPILDEGLNNSEKKSQQSKKRRNTNWENEKKLLTSKTRNLNNPCMNPPKTVANKPTFEEEIAKVDTLATTTSKKEILTRIKTSKEVSKGQSKGVAEDHKSKKVVENLKFKREDHNGNNLPDMNAEPEIIPVFLHIPVERKKTQPRPLEPRKMPISKENVESFTPHPKFKLVESGNRPYRYRTKQVLARYYLKAENCKKYTEYPNCHWKKTKNSKNSTENSTKLSKNSSAKVRIDSNVCLSGKDKIDVNNYMGDTVELLPTSNFPVKRNLNSNQVIPSKKRTKKLRENENEESMNLSLEVDKKDRESVLNFSDEVRNSERENHLNISDVSGETIALSLPDGVVNADGQNQLNMPDVMQDNLTKEMSTKMGMVARYQEFLDSLDKDTDNIYHQQVPYSRSPFEYIQQRTVTNTGWNHQDKIIERIDNSIVNICHGTLVKNPKPELPDTKNAKCGQEIYNNTAYVDREKLQDLNIGDIRQETTTSTKIKNQNQTEVEQNYEDLPFTNAKLQNIHQETVQNATKPEGMHQEMLLQYFIKEFPGLKQQIKHKTQDIRQETFKNSGDHDQQQPEHCIEQFSKGKAYQERLGHNTQVKTTNKVGNSREETLAQCSMKELPVFKQQIKPETQHQCVQNIEQFINVFGQETLAQNTQEECSNKMGDTHQENLPQYPIKECLVLRQQIPPKTQQNRQETSMNIGNNQHQCVQNIEEFLNVFAEEKSAQNTQEESCSVFKQQIKPKTQDVRQESFKNAANTDQQLLEHYNDQFSNVQAYPFKNTSYVVQEKVQEIHQERKIGDNHLEITTYIGNKHQGQVEQNIGFKDLSFTNAKHQNIHQETDLNTTTVQNTTNCSITNCSTINQIHHKLESIHQGKLSQYFIKEFPSLEQQIKHKTQDIHLETLKNAANNDQQESENYIEQFSKVKAYQERLSQNTQQESINGVGSIHQEKLVRCSMKELPVFKQQGKPTIQENRREILKNSGDNRQQSEQNIEPFTNVFGQEKLAQNTQEESLNIMGNIHRENLAQYFIKDCPVFKQQIKPKPQDFRVESFKNADNNDQLEHYSEQFSNVRAYKEKLGHCQKEAKIKEFHDNVEIVKNSGNNTVVDIYDAIMSMPNKSSHVLNTRNPKEKNMNDFYEACIRENLFGFALKTDIDERWRLINSFKNRFYEDTWCGAGYLDFSRSRVPSNKEKPTFEAFKYLDGTNDSSTDEEASPKKSSKKSNRKSSSQASKYRQLDVKYSSPTKNSNSNRSATQRSESRGEFINADLRLLKTKYTPKHKRKLFTDTETAPNLTIIEEKVLCKYTPDKSKQFQSVPKIDQKKFPQTTSHETKENSEEHREVTETTCCDKSVERSSDIDDNMSQNSKTSNFSDDLFSPDASVGNKNIPGNNIVDEYDLKNRFVPLAGTSTKVGDDFIKLSTQSAESNYSQKSEVSQKSQISQKSELSQNSASSTSKALMNNTNIEELQSSSSDQLTPYQKLLTQRLSLTENFQESYGKSQESPAEIRADGTITVVPKYNPPSKERIKTSLAHYGIPEICYQDPFYSDREDVTGNMEVGRSVLKIPSNNIQNLPAFNGYFEGLSVSREKVLRILDPEMKLTDKQIFEYRLSFFTNDSITITPVKLPPKRREVEKWLAGERTKNADESFVKKKKRLIIPGIPGGDESCDSLSLSPCSSVELTSSPVIRNENKQKRKSRIEQVKARRNSMILSQNDSILKNIGLSDSGNSHMISAATFDNSNFLLASNDFQKAKATKEYLHLTILAMEVVSITRRDYKPNPDFDKIQAILYTLFNDVPQEENRIISGGFIVNSLPISPSKVKLSILDGLNDTHKLTPVTSEEELFAEFIKFVQNSDPDIFTGYEIETLSWGYLIERGYVLNQNLLGPLSRTPDAPIRRRNHDEDHGVTITGRILIDFWRLMRHEIALQSYTFESVVYHILHQRVPCYTHKDLTEWLIHPSALYRHRVIEYYLFRTRTILRLMEQLDLIGRTSELAKLFGIQFYEVLSRGSQFRVESMMLRLAKPLNYIPVSPNVQQRARMRAPESLPLIMEPESKFYTDPVIVLDFQSLYPSMIIAYNYCFSTCLGRIEHLGQSNPFEFGASQLKIPRRYLNRFLKRDEMNISPCGVAYVKKSVRFGILPRMLYEILDTRLMVKKSLKENAGDKTLERVLDARQLGLKLIANVTYGYTAANFSGRMPCIELGDSVVSKGRETLQRAIALVEKAEGWGAKVVYGDTDSLFVLVRGKSKDDAFKIGAEIADAVTRDNPSPVKLKLEKVFLPCVLQTKKRYVGYMYESATQKEPEFLAKGIETVRRDGCPAGAKMLEKCLKLLFDTRNVSLVKKYVTRQFGKLLTGRVSIQDLTFAKEYRGADSYKAGACVPALELARKWIGEDKRKEPRRGERVPYIIVNGPPGLPLIRSVRSPRELIADPSLRPNAIYYITKVIIPPINRCFLLIGADLNQWFADMPRKQIQYLPTSTPGKNKIKKSTISQYFSSLNCAVCGKQTQHGLCQECLEKPQETCVLLHEKVRIWEKNYHQTMVMCQSCCGRIEDITCVSLDCPVYYRRVQTDRDMQQSNFVKQLISTLPQLEF